MSDCSFLVSFLVYLAKVMELLTFKKKCKSRSLLCMFFVFVSNTIYFNMSTIFLFEDGHKNVVDENGSPDPMEYIVESVATPPPFTRKVNLYRIFS
ncbi:hypothetical protein CLU79DRAFT_863100 [Phycomyces nitens]|nr:hypothetical protein CLU79DRAFT_863100 [Phycomyces nitens]